MLRQKDYVKAFLTTNFERIQEARKLNSFSWVSIIKELVVLHPTIGLDPLNEVHRDRVRNNFINIRKRLVGREVVMAKLEAIGRKQFQENLTRFGSVDRPGSDEKFHYLDTYNQSTAAPTNELEEFQLWKKEKERPKRQQGMHIVIGCVHFPAVNKTFYKAFLQFVQDASPVLKGIHLIGDIIDCKSLSSHDNGQVSDTTLDEEYDLANVALDDLDDCLPKGIEKNYIWGNHEERYAKIMKKVDVSKFGKALLSPTKGCKFVERGYTVQEDYLNGKIVLGNYLDLVHGQFITQNSAKKHLDVYKKSIMFAHTHKMGAHYDGDKASFNIGWMGDKAHSAFSYASSLTKSQWQNGFAVVYIDELGFYHVQLIQYYNGRFIFGTKEYIGHGK